MRSLKRATMNTPITDAVVSSQATRRSDRSGAPETRLRGRRLLLARVAWVAVITLLVAPFLAMLPAYSTLLQHFCLGASCSLLPVGAYATFTLALTLALAFLCFAFGAVI